MAKEIPEFEMDEETAKFWDEHDSSEYMEDAEWGQFEWLLAEDRCEFTNDEASFGKLWWKNGEQGG